MFCNTLVNEDFAMQPFERLRVHSCGIDNDIDVFTPLAREFALRGIVGLDQHMLPFYDEGIKHDVVPCDLLRYVH
jgi:hypothetical protein